jgi:hypothetical protein
MYNTVLLQIQSANTVAIGTQAGQYTQGASAVAIGTQAGQYTQGASAVAIGTQAGQTGQGANSIAIGQSTDVAHTNSIYLNASGTQSSSLAASAFYVNPVRIDSGVTGGMLLYDNFTNEIAVNPAVYYGNTSTGSGLIFDAGTAKMKLFSDNASSSNYMDCSGGLVVRSWAGGAGTLSTNGGTINTNSINTNILAFPTTYINEIGGNLQLVANTLGGIINMYTNATNEASVTISATSLTAGTLRGKTYTFGGNGGNNNNVTVSSGAYFFTASWNSGNGWACGYCNCTATPSTTILSYSNGAGSNSNVNADNNFNSNAGQGIGLFAFFLNGSFSFIVQKKTNYTAPLVIVLTFVGGS